MQKRSRLYMQRKKAKSIIRRIEHKLKKAIENGGDQWVHEMGSGVFEKHGLIGHDYNSAEYLQAQYRTTRGLLPTIAEFE